MTASPPRHPWIWIQWVVLAVFLVLWIPSFFDFSLAWMWMGFAGVLQAAIGIAELFAPAWVLDTRRRFLQTSPAWQRRLTEAFDRQREPSLRTVRIIGAVVLFLGVTTIFFAVVILLGS